MAQKLDYCLSSYALSDNKVDELFALFPTNQEKVTEEIQATYNELSKAAQSSGSTLISQILQATVSRPIDFTVSPNLFAEPA